MYLDIVEYSEDNIDYLIQLEKHIGYGALFIAIRDPSLVDRVWELNRRHKDVPLLPLLITNSHKDFSSLIGRTILCSEVEDKAGFLRAIRAPYISLVRVKLENIAKIVTPRTIHVARQYYKFIDMPLKDFIFAQPADRVRILIQLRKVTKLLSQKNIRTIVSSHANTIYEAISPRQIRAILMEIGFRDEAIKCILKENPLQLFISPLEVTVIRHDMFLETISRIHNMIKKTSGDKQ